ncbi:unnamed protein product, partial [Chrysoparadoxa australica]
MAPQFSEERRCEPTKGLSPHRSPCRKGRHKVFARMPRQSPYVGYFHYAPPSGRKSALAHSFYEHQLVLQSEVERRHKIRVRVVSGYFHSAPGKYSRLHGLQNFRRPSMQGSMDSWERSRLLKMVRQSLTESEGDGEGEGGMDSAAGRDAQHWGSSSCAGMKCDDEEYWERPRQRSSSFPGNINCAGGESPSTPSRLKRRLSSIGGSWESHTVKAQQNTKDYISHMTKLAPDMQPHTMHEGHISSKYDFKAEMSEVLGQGALGTVHPAVHTSTQEPVAIKVISKKYLLGEAERSAVMREVEHQRRLVCPHIIRLYETYQTQEHMYIVLEKAELGSLDDHLFVRHHLTELEAKIMMRQLLIALEFCHSSGIVHGDVKPGNLLLCNDSRQRQRSSSMGNLSSSVSSVSSCSSSMGSNLTSPTSATAPDYLHRCTAKLCDFGHSRAVPNVKYFKYTGDINKVPGFMARHTGSQGYVAPEILMLNAYGTSADIWSAGVVLYSLLCGRLPWRDAPSCLQTPITFSGPVWSKISDSAKSLVANLLRVEP